MKLFTTVIITLLLVSCASKDKPKETPPENTSKVEEVKYSIIKESPNESLSKDNLEIELKSKASTEELTVIANELRKSRTQYNKLWIQYYLKDQTNRALAWAVTNFTPDLSVVINGAGNDQIDRFAKASEGIDGKIIGKWLLEYDGASLYIIFQRKGKYYVREAFAKPNIGEGIMPDEELLKSMVGKAEKYQAKSDVHGEYYLITESGDLNLCNKEGKCFASGKKSKD